MGNSLLSHCPIEGNLDSRLNTYEQKRQQDLGLLLSSATETLNLKKLLESISSFENISDEMDIALGEKYSRKKNVDAFWKNITAGLEEDSPRGV